MQRIGLKRLARGFPRHLAQYPRANEIDDNGSTDNHEGRNGRFDRMLVAKESLDRFVNHNAREEEEKRRFRERRDAFELAMSVVVFVVGGLTGDADREVRHHRGGEIDQRMRGLRQDRERAGHHADHALGKRQPAGGRDRSEGNLFLVLLHLESAAPIETSFGDRRAGTQPELQVMRIIRIVFAREYDFARPLSPLTR